MSVIGQQAMSVIGQRAMSVIGQRAMSVIGQRAMSVIGQRAMSVIGQWAKCWESRVVVMCSHLVGNPRIGSLSNCLDHLLALELDYIPVPSLLGLHPCTVIAHLCVQA